MRRVLFLLSLLIVFSCSQKGEYTVNGLVKSANLDGKKVYLGKYSDVGIESLDSVVIKDNEFKFKGLQEEPAVYFVYFSKELGGELAEGSPILIFPNNYLRVTVRGNILEVGGGPENDEYQILVDKRRPLYDHIQSIEDKYMAEVENDSMTPEIEKAMEEENDKYIVQIRDMSVKYIMRNMTNPLGKKIFLDYVGMLSPNQIKDALSMTDDSFKSQDRVRKIVKLMENKENAAIGKRFVDFTLFDAQGKPVALSDYAGKGKVVLVDFWASWCIPCIKEMPVLVKAYERYKGKNFEIVGVSFDKEEKDWHEAIRDWNITWPQITDLKGCAIAKSAYGLIGIPHSVLIDGNGVIIAKDLRGEKLLAKLAEIVR